MVNVKIGVDPQFWVWRAGGQVGRWTLRKLPSDLDCTPVCRPLDTNKHKIQVQTQPHTQTQTIAQQRCARTKYITNTIFLCFRIVYPFLWPQHPFTSPAGPAALHLVVPFSLLGRNWINAFLQQLVKFWVRIMYFFFGVV